LGGQHLIFGVNLSDYQEFAEAICKTLKKLLGKDFTEENNVAWMTTIIQLGETLFNIGKKIKEESLTGIVDIRKKRDGPWKRRFLSLSLDTISIYKSEKMIKLKHSISISTINDLDKFNIYEHDSYPSNHGLGLSLGSTKLPNIWICSTEKYSQIWRDQITWRRAAALWMNV